MMQEGEAGMRGNRRIAVFAFTRAYGEQKFYKRLEQEGWETALTACENLEGTNCYCGGLQRRRSGSAFRHLDFPAFTSWIQEIIIM